MNADNQLAYKRVRNNYVRHKLFSMYSSDLRSTLMDDSDVCQTEVNVEKSKCPMVVGFINNVRTEILIDTGAEVSVISRRFINRNKKHFRQCSMLPINQL